MATSGKKGKKKAKTIPLQHFLANGTTTQPGLTQVAKKVRNRDDSDDDDIGGAPLLVYQLPTAPRANRIYEDDDCIPHKPPFLAYITNLPFDINEDDIYDFFNGYKIESVRLPREDGEYGRVRGFGYIQFETRDDLINAISLPDPQIKNRRIRINVSSENDQQKEKRNMGNRNRYDGFGSGGGSDNKESTNWRRGGEGGGGDDDRRGRHNYSRGGDRDRNRDRDRDNDRYARDSSTGGEAGSWRTGDRPNIESTSPGRREGGGGRGGFGDRFSGRKQMNDEKPPERERPKLILQPRTLPLPEFVVQPEAEKERDSDVESEKSENRVITPEPPPAPKPKPAGVSAEKVFGGAKPVDTAAREKEIEERLERERLEKLKLQEEENEKEKEKDTEEEKNEIDEKSEEKHTEKDEKDNRNAATSWRKRDDDGNKRNYDQQRRYSPDRRGPLRRNDDRRGGNIRDNRDNRDRRDYRDNRGGYDRDNRNIDNRDRDNRFDRNDRENYNRGGGRDRDRDRGYNRDNKGNIRDHRDNRDRDRDRDHRDNRHRDDKPKQRERDNNKQDRPMPKYQPQQSGPVLSTSNKYAVFQDEDDASD